MHSSDRKPLPSRSDQARLWLAVGAAVLGGIVLLGWAFGNEVLKAVIPRLTTMKANTAIGLSAAGIALAMLPRLDRIAPFRGALAFGLGVLVAVIGSATLFEYGFGISLGIDELAFADPNTTSPPYPGRMAPATAVGFLCIGLAITLLASTARSSGRETRTSIAHGLAAVPAGAGYLSLAGYVYDVPGLYNLGPFASVALNTAVGFLLLASSILCARADLGWSRVFERRPLSRAVLRRLVPLTLVLPFVTGAVIVAGIRLKIYDPLFGSALFTLGAAGLSLLLAWIAVNAVRHAEAALIESNARLQVIFDTVPVGIIFAEAPSGKLMFGNAAIEQVFRHKMVYSDTVDTYRAWEAYHPDGRRVEGHEYPLAITIETRKPSQAEVLYVCGDGVRRWIYITSAPVLGSGGTMTGAVVVCSDIDQTKRAELVLARDKEDLEQLVLSRTKDLEATQMRLAHVQRMEALGKLAGGIAHDFNNVIQAVQGGAALIERSGDNPDRVRSLARMVIDAADRGASVTRRMLAFSRRGDLRAEAVDVRSLLEGMRDILVHTIGAGIAVEVEASDTLPPLLADKGQLDTVLVNLATNGRDAMGHSGTLRFTATDEHVEPLAHHVAGLKPGRYVSIAVADTGSGMSAEVLARASEPFFTTKDVGKGTGLGLAMARGFAEQSGGGFGITSVQGQGTVVTIWLPASTRAVRRVEPFALPVEPADPALASIRVLLVDDDALVRDTLALGLESEGFTVVSAPSGAAALQLLDRGEPVRLLISDLSMPGMDGLTLVREAQRRRPDLPAILLTGFATNAAEIAVGGAVSGSFSLLRKPIAVRQLAERISVLLEDVKAS